MSADDIVVKTEIDDNISVVAGTADKCILETHIIPSRASSKMRRSRVTSILFLHRISLLNLGLMMQRNPLWPQSNRTMLPLRPPMLNKAPRCGNHPARILPKPVISPRKNPLRFLGLENSCSPRIFMKTLCHSWQRPLSTSTATKYRS